MRQSSKVELVNHPVRMRILGLFGNRHLTPKQIAEVLPEVPQATLYRQIKVLHDGGILEVVGRRQAHGVLESTYAMVSGSAHFTREEFAALSPDEHRSALALLQAGAASAIDRYVANPTVDTTNDGMTYFSASLSLTDEEARQFRIDLLSLIQSYAKELNEERRQRLVTVSVIPEPQP